MLAKTLNAISILMLLGGLLVTSTVGSNAQSSSRTFLDLLRPCIDKEILLSSPSTQYPRSVILKEIQQDYVVIETDKKATEAIFLYSMNSITLGEPMQLHLNR
jgi:hypothetical protein